MKWEMISPSSGDVVRVKAGSIWHYGIYVSDDEVIQFGATPTSAAMLMGADIAVISSDIDSFLIGGFLEVAVFDKKELKSKRPPEEIVKAARSRIGEEGYHILHNNCEHFAFECATGQHRCEQVDSVRDKFRSLPLLDVYVAEIPQNISLTRLYPKKRNAEVEACKNERVRLEKYCVWKLLELAVDRSFGLKLEDLDFKKDKNGKWSADKLFFSLSHSNGVVAVAVSRKPVGVDVEALVSIRGDKLQNRVFSPSELEEYNSLAEEHKKLFMLEMWTKKESEFKRSGGGSFSPALTHTTATKTVQFEHMGNIYMLSVANDDLERLKFHGIDQIKL